jgi:hypothetical protein
MILKHLFAGALLASLVSTAVPSSAQVDAKWFVLRNHEVGNCWTATLVRLDVSTPVRSSAKREDPTIPRSKLLPG